MGDFNALHTLWNSKSCDANNGNCLLTSIESNNLIIYNTNTLTRVDFSRGHKSNLDLIISTTNLTKKTCVCVCDETYGSDHFPVLTALNIMKNTYVKKSFRIESKRTNWKGVIDTLNANCHKFLDVSYCNLTPSLKYQTFLTQ